MASFLPTVYATASPSVTDDEFNLFHSIDRKLYSRLIINLGRDPTESMQVIAFWLWLEQEVVDNLTLVKQMLSWPQALLNELADESVQCLKCVESDTFPVGEKKTNELVLLPSFVERNISFQYFHENRIGVLRGVSKMIGEVCSRAFRDLLEKTIRGTGFFPLAPNGTSGQTFSTSEKRNPGGVGNQKAPLVEKVGGQSSSSVGDVGNSSNVSGSGVVTTVQTPSPANTAAAYPYCFPYYSPMPPIGSVIFPLGGGSHLTQDQIIENELSHRLSTTLGALVEEDDEVSPDERTIFLTFSKGYPITETEVREFFTRKFGDFIEAIHLQEVQPNEQVLYARVIAKSSSVLDAVVEGGRAKYTINGKHVWARKYVRKPKSPPRNAALSTMNASVATLKYLN